MNLYTFPGTLLIAKAVEVSRCEEIVSIASREDVRKLAFDELLYPLACFTIIPIVR